MDTPFASLAYFRGLPLFLLAGSKEEGERSPPKSLITRPELPAPAPSPSLKKEEEEVLLELGLVMLMLKSDADVTGSELRLGVEFRLDKVRMWPWLWTPWRIAVGAWSIFIELPRRM